MFSHHNCIYLMFFVLENGHDGTSATGFRSLNEPFDHPAFVKALGETFAARTGSKELIDKGDFPVTLGQVAFAAYKVNRVTNSYSNAFTSACTSD